MEYPELMPFGGGLRPMRWKLSWNFMPFWQGVSWAYSFLERALGKNLVYAFVQWNTYQFNYLHSVLLGYLFKGQQLLLLLTQLMRIWRLLPQLQQRRLVTPKKLDSHLPEMKYIYCNLCPAQKSCNTSHQQPCTSMVPENQSKLWYWSYLILNRLWYWSTKLWYQYMFEMQISKNLQYLSIQISKTKL